MRLQNLLLAGTLLFAFNAEAAKPSILYVPMDNRPVCLDYTVQTMQAAGWDVEVPPLELIANAKESGKSDELFDWLESKSEESVAVVASSDALLYGGLVGSRTHEIPLDTIKARAERLLSLKKNTHNQKIYLFTTIMRSPKASSAPVEPAYYAQWGPKLFRLGALEDKQELDVIKRKERKELAALRSEIPEDVLTDLYNRRGNNLKATELLLSGIEAGDFDYALLGRDDTASYSQAHREARAMDILVRELPKGRIRFFAGADQLGLILLQRAASRLQYELPLVAVKYAEGKGGQTIPSYEDNTVAESAKQHIFAAGAFPIRKLSHADVILSINTPKNGVCLEASNVANTDEATPELCKFVSDIANTIYNEKKPVIVADVKYGNGADNGLVPLMFKEGVAYDVAAYGGWNTSGNALGFALAQGLLASKMSKEDHDSLLKQRYLDDWAYQANARMQVYQTLIWPKQWPNSGLKDWPLRAAEKAVAQAIKEKAEPLMQEAVHEYKFTLPWQRMFEVQVSKNIEGKQ